MFGFVERHLSMAVRLAVVACGVGFLAALLQTGTHPRRGPALSQSPHSALAEGNDELRVASRAWALAADGWVIRVDGADVAIPSFVEQARSHPRASVTMTISPYDHIIVANATAEGFDWRLVAALIFEESRFNPDSESHKGAYGLMQVRPIAAAQVGEERFHEPEDNIRTGVRYLSQLDQMFTDVGDGDRLSFVLAAYHMGPAHVRDAQKLARRLGYDARRWEGGVALIAPLLEQPAIHKDLAAGYAKGSLTVGYVQRILERYEHYLRHTG